MGGKSTNRASLWTNPEGRTLGGDRLIFLTPISGCLELEVMGKMISRRTLID